MRRHANFQKRFLIFTSVLTAFLVFACFSVFGQTSGEIQKLSLNKPIERQIKGGEIHSFHFNVKAGIYARAEVEQKNVDVVVSLFDSTQKLVVEMNGYDGWLWREAVSVAAEKGEVYRVEVKALGAADAAGSFRIKLAELRPAQAADKSRLQAERHLSAGRQFQDQGGASHETAIKEFETALPLWRAAGEPNREAVTLHNLAWTLGNLSRHEQAIAAHQKAAALFRQTNDLIGEGKAYNGLGFFYFSLARFDKASEFHERALSIRRAIKDRRGEGWSLANLGWIYNTLGQYEKAGKYYEPALAAAREVKDNTIAAAALNGLGFIYQALGNYEKAVLFYEQSLLNSREIQNRHGERWALLNLSNANLALLRYEKSVVYSEQGLKMSREFNDRNGESVALLNLGVAFQYLNQNEKSQNYLEQSLVLNREIKDLQNLALANWNLLLLWQKLDNRQRAIFHGKQAVSVFQEIRANLKSFDRVAQQSFLKDKEPVYRALSDILIAEGRLPEAQAILDLLKDEEYEQSARSNNSADTVPYSRAETDAIDKIENRVALERERSELQKVQKETGTLSDAQLKQLAKLDSEIEAANKAFDNALDALGKAESSATTRADEIKNGKELQGALTRLGAKTKSGVVALYTVLGTEEAQAATDKTSRTKTKFGWVIMVTPDGYKAYPINVAGLEETVFAFRNALSSDKYNPQPLAEKIYAAIFRQTSDKQKRSLENDLRDYLKPYADKTVMWSLDGVLRYIPMAALHDGSNYLVENYRSVIFTKNSFVSLTEENQDSWIALGVGVSEKRENFNPLPGVKTELDAIVRQPSKQGGILNGKIELNENFQKQKFFSAVRGGAYPVVHIASHYSFDPAQLDESFLLVGDGHLTFGEMKEKQNLFGALDLLTLSACDTGVSGNGKEAEGFAYLAQSLGAKSVIASLWKVSDAGTPELMIRFYKLRNDNPQMSKGEAFRRAQLSLLGTETANSGNANSNRSGVVDFGGRKIELPLYQKDEKKPFAHPHYWSSFVLIGNWR